MEDETPSRRGKWSPFLPSHVTDTCTYTCATRKWRQAEDKMMMTRTLTVGNISSKRKKSSSSSSSSSWYQLEILLLLILMCMCHVGAAMCPPKCTCDDDTLKATCEDAALEEVPIQLNPDVRTIVLQRNRITNVHLSLPFYTNLRWLDVSRNRITTLGSRNFEFQQKLIHLNVSGNEITNLGKETFKGLKNLRTLDLSENMIKNLEGLPLSDLPDLTELYMNRNKILSIGDRVFDHLSNLRVLKLDDNQLLEIPTMSLRRLPALKILGLSGNFIEMVDEDSVPPLRDLRTLALQNNLISVIHRAAFDGLQSLQILDLSENNLTSIPTAQLSKLTNLAELDVSGNNFKMLEPVAFQSLFELRKLSVCRLPTLRKVDVRAFVDNIKLERVIMDDNRALQSLPTRLFHGNPVLVDISVRGNAFTSLDSSHFPLDRLHTLSLSDNPLHCNCSLLWLWLLTKKQVENDINNVTTVSGTSSPDDAIPRLDIEEIRCSQPDSVRNQRIMEIPESEVRCDASWLAVIIVTIVVMALFALTCAMMLLLGNGKWCKKREEVVEGGHHTHLQNGAVLMLMTTKDNMENFMVNTKDPLVGEMQFQQWDTLNKENAMAESHVYNMNGSTKKPAHIVYV